MQKLSRSWYFYWKGKTCCVKSEICVSSSAFPKDHSGPTTTTSTETCPNTLQDTRALENSQEQDRQGHISWCKKINMAVSWWCNLQDSTWEVRGGLWFLVFVWGNLDVSDNPWWVFLYLLYIYISLSLYRLYSRYFITFILYPGRNWHGPILPLQIKLETTKHLPSRLESMLGVMMSYRYDPQLRFCWGFHT